MDSTRGGPLSTLILMLPLVVVPAIALLRPAERDSGFVGGEVGATEEDGFSLGPSDFDSVFGDPDQDSDAQTDGFREFTDDDAFRRSPGEASPYFDGDESPFLEGDEMIAMEASPANRRSGATTNGAQSPGPGLTGRPGTKTKPLPNLTHLGVRHSLWFATGSDSQFGFVAFVATDRPSVRYRFSAIQNTEARAVADVTEQIRVWQQEQRGAKIRREE